jgi:hypothetical protein
MNPFNTDNRSTLHVARRRPSVSVLNCGSVRHPSRRAGPCWQFGIVIGFLVSFRIARFSGLGRLRVLGHNHTGPRRFVS